MTTWNNALAAAEEHVRKLGRENRANVLNPEKNSRPGVWHDYADEEHPFKARFGDDWKNHLPRSVSTLTSIQELVDHTIDEGNRLFAGTAFANTWLIYHDALPQWWEKETQEYIQSRGFAQRQWRANAETNAVLPRHYRDRLMGDSPELMPLDSSLFSDLIEKVAWLVVSTTSLKAEGKHYSMDTPDNAWKTMVAAWGEIPQKRVVDNIKRFESALDAIIAADGAYVSDKDLRNGHRMVMQRLVRGGAIRNGDNNGTKMTVEEGLDKIMASWKGLTKKLEARA